MKNNRKNVLIVYNYLLHYRIPLFSLLSESYNVTILHSGKQTVEKNGSYNEILVPVRKFGPFYFQKGVLKETRKDKYDVIIALFDLRWVYTTLSIFFHKRTTKFILWGAWFTKSRLANRLRIILTKMANASIFYTYKSMKDFIDRGLDKNLLFVANNTVSVGDRINSYKNSTKKYIIFVGSLDKRKENDILIGAFVKVLDKIPSYIQLILIGEGPEKQNLTDMVLKLNLSERILFLGRINEPEKLKQFYMESIISVSFGQAGLSVLQALGFGVPFLTKINAISGGEITNIKNMNNGIICEDSQDSLEEALMYSVNNLDKMLQMGENAFNYYSKYCSIENYAQGFKDAIENTRIANVDTNI